MIPYENPFEQEVALQSFLNSLDAEKNAIDEAQVKLNEANSAFENAKKRYDTLKSLIQRLQGDGADALEQNDDTEPSPNPHTANDSSEPPLKKGPLREDLLEITRSSNVIRETGEFMTLVRASRGPTPKSSIAGALGGLSDAGLLKRARNLKPGTSYYGLPEWFDGDTPRREHLPEQLLNEDHAKPKTAPVEAGAESEMRGLLPASHEHSMDSNSMSER